MARAVFLFRIIDRADVVDRVGIFLIEFDGALVAFLRALPDRPAGGRRCRSCSTTTAVFSSPRGRCRSLRDTSCAPCRGRRAFRSERGRSGRFAQRQMAEKRVSGRSENDRLSFEYILQSAEKALLFSDRLRGWILTGSRGRSIRAVPAGAEAQLKVRRRRRGRSRIGAARRSEGTSHPETVVRSPLPPCSGQVPTGSVPAINTSGVCMGHCGVAGIPDSGSMVTVTTPSGASNGLASAYRRSADGPLHEFRPDGQRGMRAFDIELAVVVEAHPYDAKQVGSEAGEPAVVRRSGLAGRRRGEAARANARRGAGAHHFFEHVDDEVIDARIEHRPWSTASDRAELFRSASLTSETNEGCT